ncbi:MAG: tellurium resistance protein TehB [Arcobacter sp.]|uniref:methyltransferase domain-containing protein n=1 Tax=uncultured Arcobacter sp. TaxID=165434 RepID=UPI000CAF8966|nr:methyltransferase domain-containing protein [uncultured Arcobacter sp.]PLY11031.1 MAG: tellurium resistance protein TehB [Arcobacter sp.]
MAQKDKTKWDKKYNETPSLLEKREPSKKLIEILDKVKGKKTLDVACGAGRNSIYLATKGFDVDAMDISQVALDELDKKGFENISTKLVDLDEYEIPKNSYDLIVMTNFLNRKLIPKLSNALKINGILFIETYMEDKDNEKPPSNPDFLLKKDELKSFFNEEFEVLDYDEFFNESYELYRMKKQAITIKKL